MFCKAGALLLTRRSGTLRRAGVAEIRQIPTEVAVQDPIMKEIIRNMIKYVENKEVIK